MRSMVPSKRKSDRASRERCGKRWFRRVAGIVAVLALAVVSSLAVRAQDEAEVDEEDAAPFVERPEVVASQFDSWVYHEHKTRDGARAKLESRLQLEVEELVRVGGLGDAEREKLLLVGRGDIARFEERVDAVRRRFVASRTNDERYGDIWQQIQPLQRDLLFGIFGEDSLLRRSLRQMLSAEQAALCEGSIHDRKAFLYRARIEWTVAMLDNAMMLRDDQRQKFVDVLLKSTKPPRRLGEHDHYVILWQASRLGEEKLKPLFDEFQWKVLHQQFANLEGIERHLRKTGSLLLEGDPLPEESPTSIERLGDEIE